MGFRSPPSKRMAVLWIRCVFGPHLQRIHRSPEQPLPEGRTARRVWLIIISCLPPSTAICQKNYIILISAMMYLRQGPGSVYVIDVQLHRTRVAVNE